MADNRLILTVSIDPTSPKVVGNIDKEIAELSKQLKSLKLNVDVDQTQLSNLIKNVNAVKSAMGSKPLQIFDASSIQKYYLSVEEIVKEYQKLGTLKIDSKLDPLTSDITKLTLNLTEAEGVVKKLTFDLANLASENGNLTKAFVLGNVSQTDNTAKLREQALQKEQQIRAQLEAQKEKDAEQELKNLQQEEAKREAVLQAEQKIRNAIDENIQKEQQKTAQLEQQLKIYQQQAELNVSNALSGSYKNKIDTTALNDYLGKVKSLSVNDADLKNQMQDLDMHFKQITTSAKNASDTFGYINNSVKTAVSSFLLWGVATTAVMQTLHFFEEGVTYVNDLNKALTDISIVTGQSQQQVAGLTQQYAALGNAMKVPMLELANTAADIYRQGITNNDDVMKRMQDIIEYAKISSLSIQQANEILTATVNSMGISAQRASDVFSLLGDATSTGADEVGKAFQKMGGTASALHVPFEFAASEIAVLSSKTRESAETIGASLNSLMSRFEQLREKGFTQDDNTQVSQVSKALAAVNVQLLDGQGNFRNYMDVLKDLSNVWPTLTNRQQAYVATSLAG